jgi:coatomer subunit beta'
MKLRAYNYNTQEKIKEWDAHTDYIRFVEVHPNRPFVLRLLRLVYDRFMKM